MEIEKRRKVQFAPSKFYKWSMEENKTDHFWTAEQILISLARCFSLFNERGGLFIGSRAVFLLYIFLLVSFWRIIMNRKDQNKAHLFFSYVFSSKKKEKKRKKISEKVYRL